MKPEKRLTKSHKEGFCIVEVVFNDANVLVDLLILQFNTVFEEQIGSSGLKNKSLLNCLPNSEIDLIEKLNEILLTGEPIQSDIYLTKTQRWCEISVSYLGKKSDDFLVIRLNEINNPTQPHIDLSKLSLKLDSAQTGIYVWNINENKIEFNEKVKEILGLSSTGEISSDVFFEKIYEIDKQNVKEAVDRSLNNKNLGKQYSEFRISKTNSDKINWIQASWQVFFESDDPVRLIGTFQDITERKELENNLHLKDLLLSQITDATPTMLARCSKDFTYLFVNKATADFHGYPKEFMIGQAIPNIIGAKAFEAILPYVKKILEGEKVEYEIDLDYSTVGKRDMHVVYTPEKDCENNIIGWFATLTDITERKKAQQNNLYLASIIEFSNDAIISTNIDGVITSWNLSAEKMFGFNANEIIGKSTTLLIPSSLSSEEIEILRRIKNGESIKHYETIRQQRNGSLFEVSLTISPIKDEFGNIIGVSKIVRDISDRKQTESKLREQQYFTQTIIEAVPSLIYIYDVISQSSNFLSPQLVQILGYTPEEVEKTGAHFFKKIFHPSDNERFINKLSKTVINNKEEFSLEYRMQHKNGKWIWLWSRNRIFKRNSSGEAIQILGVATDITSRKEAEQKLRRSEEFHSIISTISTDWAFSAEIKSDGQIIPDSITNGFTKHLGYTLKSLEETGGWKILIHPEDLSPILKQSKKLLKGESIGGNVRNISKYGHTLISEYKIRPITDKKGNIVRIYGAIRDITQQKISEQFILESEERLKTVVESATEYAIFSITLDGIINSWSLGAEKIFGYSSSEITGKSVEILFTQEDRENNILQTKMQIADQQGRAFDDRFLLKKDGSQFYTSAVMMPIVENGKTKGFVKIARDMTSQLEAEKALRELEMLQELVNAQEEERRRIARNLHDELGQQLIALRLKIENIRNIAENNLIQSELDKAQEIAKQIDDGIDFFAWELRPATLDDLGIYRAIEKYINEWSQYSGIIVELLPSSIKDLRFSLETEINLYRIVQEALNNINKHAHAKKAEIVLEKRENKIVLIIADDGKGFVLQSKANNNTKIGLIGMQERVTLLGGDLEIESVLEKGTTIYVKVPIVFA